MIIGTKGSSDDVLSFPYSAMSWFSVAYEFDVRAFRCSTAALALVALQHVIFFVWNFETFLGEAGLVPPGARAGLGPPTSRTAIPNYFFLLNHLCKLKHLSKVFQKQCLELQRLELQE